MPNLDGTGPEGRGPLTGRKRGRCVDKKNTEQQIDLTGKESNDPPAYDRPWRSKYRSEGKFGERRKEFRRRNRSGG